MNLYVIRRRQAWKTVSELEKAASISARVGNEEMPDRIRWIRSYVVKEADGQLGTVCIYQSSRRDRDPRARPARGDASRRDHAHRRDRHRARRPHPGGQGSLNGR